MRPQAKKSGRGLYAGGGDRNLGGITKNTTAKITLGHGLIYDKMMRRLSEDTARLYAQAQRKAIKEYALLCKDIDCDFETQDNYVYSLSDRKKSKKRLPLSIALA